MHNSNTKSDVRVLQLCVTLPRTRGEIIDALRRQTGYFRSRGLDNLIHDLLTRGELRSERAVGQPVRYVTTAAGTARLYVLSLIVDHSRLSAGGQREAEHGDLPKH